MELTSQSQNIGILDCEEPKKDFIFYNLASGNGRTCSNKAEHKTMILNSLRMQSKTRLKLADVLRSAGANIVDKYEYEEQDMIDDICNFIDEWMETWQKKKFKEYKKIKKASWFSTTIVMQMYESFKEIKKVEESKKDNNIEEKYVVVSESIIL